MDDPRISLIITAILIYLASWFAVCETALASVSKNKLKIASDRGDFRADDALYALDNFDRAITTILICTNIVHIAAASIVTVMVTRLYGLSWVTLSTVIMTLLVFFFGEMLPKSIAKKNPEKYSLSHSGILIRLMKILKPLSSLLAGIGNFASKLTKSEAEVSITEDELHDIIDDLEEEGTLEEDESDLIQSAIEFGDTKVANVFTPKDKIKYVDINDSAAHILEVLKNQPHSRLPVCDGDLDHIKGIIQLRVFIKEYLNKKDKTDISALMSKPLFIKQNYNIDDVLDLMADHKYTLAVVQNNQGKTMGLISIEDILEELVGEIWDEDDPIKGGKA